MTKTINGLTATTSAASGDYLPIWRASNADTRKITKANFLGTLLTGGTLTGGGTVATGGFSLTIPASGTAALLARAQTFTEINTFNEVVNFSDGINFGDDTLEAYKDTGLWSPVVSDAESAGTDASSYTTQSGSYIKIGKLVLVSCQLVNIVKGSMTAGNAIWIKGFPFASKSTTGYVATAACGTNAVTYASGEIQIVLNANKTACQVMNNVTAAGQTALTVAALTSNTSDIVFSMAYASEA